MEQKQRPEWLTETPPETEYSLLMVIDPTNGEHDQDIALSRQEFIGLKKHLAKMRGIAVEPAEQDTQDCGPLGALNSADINYARICLKIVETGNGALNRPVEEFLFNLIDEFRVAHGMTPERAEELVSDFRTSFGNCIEISRELATKYPPAVLAHIPALRKLFKADPEKESA